jgi:hypothetical protein
VEHHAVMHQQRRIGIAAWHSEQAEVIYGLEIGNINLSMPNVASIDAFQLKLEEFEAGRKTRTRSHQNRQRERIRPERSAAYQRRRFRCDGSIDSRRI